MVSTLDVEKLGASVSLSFDGEKLTIQGDKDARKKAKPSQSLFCLPSQPQQQQDPTQFPIPNVNILHAAYNPNTNMVQFSAVIPKEPHQPESEAQLYKFMYTVKQEEKQKAIDFCNTIITHAYKDIVFEKRLKILINPFSGQAKAKQIFESHVKPIFEASKCKCDIQFTEHQGHALDIAKDLNIQDYDAIVTVSGDGLIHEVLNGFLQRSDARQAVRKVPIGAIPCGTSNSLAISMLGEKLGFDPVQTALQVVKGRPLGLDVCSVTFDDHRYYSFLSHSYGIAAYADLGTEHMRWMGDSRVVVGLLQEIFLKHTYQVEASILVQETDKSKIKETAIENAKSGIWRTVEEGEGEIKDTIPPLNEPVPEHWMKINQDISVFLTSKLPLLNRGMLSHPCATPNDGAIDLLLVRGGHGFTKQLDVFTKVEDATHFNLDFVEYFKVKAFRLKPILKPGKTAYLAVDGEHAPCKPFQVEVHQCLGNILSLSPTYITNHLTNGKLAPKPTSKEISKKSTEGNRMRTFGYRLLFGLCIYFVVKRLPLKSLAKYARIKA